MGSMKVTVSLAMRARDVSRPRPEHLAEAAAREESVPPRVRPAPAVQPPPPRSQAAHSQAAQPREEPESQQRTRRRRRRGR